MHRPPGCPVSVQGVSPGSPGLRPRPVRFRPSGRWTDRGRQSPRGTPGPRGTPNPRTFNTRFRREVSAQNGSALGKRCSGNVDAAPETRSASAVPPDLQKHSHDGQSVGLVRGLHEAGVFVRVPVNHVELKGRSTAQGKCRGRCSGVLRTSRADRAFPRPRCALCVWESRVPQQRALPFPPKKLKAQDRKAHIPQHVRAPHDAPTAV